MVEPRDAVGVLCAQLPVLRRCDPEKAEQLAADARAGRDFGSQLSRLLLQMELPGTADTERSGLGGPALVGGFGRHSAHEVFRCPGDRCARVQARRPAAPAPVCHLEDAPLRLTRS
ncbi:hypothetical protein F9278_28490 [Streptomyces phaeolivaceus]|uniref:Uncharacterized protein n=1 Tax=Streptomyces phaeolivaceus TaxID=2653200 RepID=A0A5P8K9G1_9ACTN|nr:hypothetical protein [Streptomyces phaeolivaceus]QFQ99438.1 hypothetical protein F9278_28490 [Streptomyces phaeolivaceus]